MTAVNRGQLTAPNIGEEQIGNGARQHIYRCENGQLIGAGRELKAIDAVFCDLNCKQQQPGSIENKSTAVNLIHVNL